MPRWYWWIAGVFAVRATWENVHPVAAAALGTALIVGYWGYRVVVAANEVPAHRAHAAQREVRRIATELGDVALGWALIILVLLGIAAVVATWPPNWKLIALVFGSAVLALLVIVGSWRGVSRMVDRIQTRRWEERREGLDAIVRAWNDHALATTSTDRSVAEQVVLDVYERRGERPPTIEWARSPAEFSRLVEAGSRRRTLGRTPPWWMSTLLYSEAFLAWSRIWSAADRDLRDLELEAAFEAAIGTPRLEELVANTPWFSFSRRSAILLEHPVEVHLDDEGDLHNETGPAIRFADGWALWALRGVAVPAEAIEDPDRFDPQVALQHENVEVRRVLLDHLGWDRVVRGVGLTPLTEDEHGRLWRLPVEDSDPVLLLEVENATPDDDGVHRSYFLRVPPTMQSPREATAWTFGLSELEYAPDAAS